MNTNTNKQLEKALSSVMTRVKEDQKKKEEQQYKKNWSEIKIPFSLIEGLNKLTKSELDDIRKSLQIKGASGLKKADLIDLLHLKIPELLEEIVLQWDEDRYNILKKIALNDGYILAPDLESSQIEYFRKQGLIYTGTFEGNKVVAIPNELIESVLLLEEDAHVKTIIHRNTEWIKLTNGLLFYYGILSETELIKMIEVHTKESLDLQEFLPIIEEVNSYLKGYKRDDEGYSNVRVLDSKRVKQEQEKRKYIPYYPFTKQQLLKAGELGFIERNHSYERFVNYLIQHYEINREKAERFVEVCVYATKNGEGPNHILKYLDGIFEIKSLEVNQAFREHVYDLMNHTREWFLKGYTATELSKEDRSLLRKLPSMMKPHRIGKKVIKVGRNDPCPCGSGKKYKKCCER